MKHIICLSGGLDSATILYGLLEETEKDNIISVFFNYGQKAVEKERESVSILSDKTEVMMTEINVIDIFIRSNSKLLKHRKAPVTEILQCGNNMEYVSKETEVEFRNGVMLSVCISIAMQLFPNDNVTIYYGAAKTREPYPDCSLVFAEYMNLLSSYTSGGKVTVKAPLLNMGKDEIVARAKKLGVPINKTWSCYEGKEMPCGMCHACLDRKIMEVFDDN